MNEKGTEPVSQVNNARENNLNYIAQAIQENNTKSQYDLACYLANTGTGKKSIIADNLDRLFHFSEEKRKIKTIALYHESLRKDGIGRVLANLSGILADIDNGEKYNIILITEEDPNEYDYEVPPIVTRVIIPAYKTCRNNYQKRGDVLNHIISQFRIDAIVYSAWLGPCLFWDFLCAKTNERHPAFFVHIHSFCSKIWRYSSNCVEETWKIFPLTDGIITLSETDRQYWSYVNKNVNVIWNPPANASENKISKKNTWRTGQKHILWMGRISDEKQPLEMISIMKHVVRQLPNAVCHIVGKENRAGNLTKTLMQYIEENHLQNNVILEGYHKNVGEIYRNTDVYVSTSEYEGFPMTFMEAASYGIPTVTYNIPWIEYYRIMDGWETVEQYDAEKAALYIAELLTNQEKWENSNRRLYESFQKYRQHNFSADWVRLFENYEKSIPTPQAEPNKDMQLILDNMVKFHSRAIKNLSKSQEQNSPVSQSEIDAIYNSASYKVGNIIIMPLHIIKTVIKKFKQIVT